MKTPQKQPVLKPLKVEAEDSGTTTLPLEFEPDQGDRGARKTRERSKLYRVIQILKAELSQISEILDEDLVAYQERVLAQILDYSSARSAAESYNTMWFGGMAYSLQGKRMLASALKDRVAMFKVIPHPCWDLLLQDDPDTIQAVRYNKVLSTHM